MAALAASGCLLAAAAPALAAPKVRSGAAADAAELQAVVDQLRADLGEPNNGNTPGAQPGGRREINWDGAGAAAPATTFPIPMTTFSTRGNVFETPGTGFEISGQPAPEFGDINPTYPNRFTTFSSPRLFTPLGSNITDVRITVPATIDVPARTEGFAVVFTDVDFENTTSLEFFDRRGRSRGVFFAPVSNNGLSFVGAALKRARIARVRILTGNSPLGPNDGGAIDVVDDFLYGEPKP